MGLTGQIKQKAIELGFDLVGITDAAPLHSDYLNNLMGWLDAGYAGQMTWLHNNLDKRTDPGKLLPGAQSLIVVGLNYKPPLSLRAQHSGAKQSQTSGLVAAYARYEDYHPFIKKQLRKLVDFIVVSTGPGLKFKICVDSTPLLERAFAAKAGLGFIGKNHALTNPVLGPQIFLGEIITNLEIEPDAENCRAGFNPPIPNLKSAIRNPQSEIGSCDSCNKCVAVCPTGALRPDGRFDASKCISYLTIESNTEIPSDLAPKIGNHLFGCAECLLACPYQQKAPPRQNNHFVYYPDRARLDLNDLINLTEDEFHSRFANSPLLRPGLSHLKHTAKICLGNLSKS
jgi:epoxyqueuosine reductase